MIFCTLLISASISGSFQDGTSVGNRAMVIDSNSSSAFRLGNRWNRSSVTKGMKGCSNLNPLSMQVKLGRSKNGFNTIHTILL